MGIGVAPVSAVARNSKAGPDGLDTDGADAFLKRERAAQRVGFVFLAVFVIAGAAGVFGNGPLSSAVLQQGATHITYERFTRQTVLTGIAIAVSGLSEDKVDISVSREFLQNLMELEVRPDSVTQRVEADAIVFEVPVTTGTARVELHYKPRDFGLYRADVGVKGASAARFWQLIYF